MFCDMVGSSALSTRLDPEEQRDVVGAFQACCAREIKVLGGMVAQYLGDGVLAYFGYPAAHEDDAERALRAGLGILDAVGKLRIVPGVTLQARVGVASGVVVVGDLVREGLTQENAAIGVTTNLAARLQSLAEPNSMVVAPETHRLVDVLFEYRDLGRHLLKGFAEPVQVRQVLRPSRIENRFEVRHRRGKTPILGRDEEMELLWRRWEQAKRGQGRAVLLTGEAGIGKSRLTRALQERIASEPHIQLIYHCSPYHQDSALYPVTSQLLRAAGIERDDDDDRRLNKLEALLAQSSDRPGEHVPLLAALLSIPAARYPNPNLTPQQVKERTLDILIAQLTYLSKQKPVLMVFEDLHWIDPTSLELLTRIIELSPTLRLLVIATARPEFLPTWANHGYVSTLSLNRLDGENIQRLVSGVTSGKSLPAEVLDQIATRTDGVPLFVEELTKMVLESGLMHETENGFELLGPLPPLAIPTTLQASLMARLDRLASVKDIAQIGSVIGREFPHSLLSAVAAIAENELEGALKRLIEAGLLFRRGVPPAATYQFKHALVQDAAYTSMVRSRREQLHRRVAEALAADRSREINDGAIAAEIAPRQGGFQPNIIAFHFQAAQRPDQALPFHKLAADRAVKWGVHGEAHHHFSAALTHLEKIDDRSEHRVQMLIGKARSLHYLGAREEAASLLEANRPIVESIAGFASSAYYHLTWGQVQSFLGHRAPARDGYRRALELARISNDLMLVAEANWSLGTEYSFSGDYGEAVHCHETAIQILSKNGDSCILGMSLVFLGQGLVTIGRAKEALDVLLQASDMAKRLTDKVLKANAAYGLGRYYVEIGEYSRAMSVAGEAMQDVPNAFEEAILSWIYATAQYHVAPKEPALATLRVALAKARNYRSVQVQAYAMTEYAEALIRFDEYREAVDVIEDGMRLADSIGAKATVARLTALGGRLHLNCRRFTQAEKCLLQARASAQSLKAPLLTAWIEIDLFKLYRALANAGAADPFLRSAHVIFRNVDAPIHVAFTEKVAVEHSVDLVK